MGASDRQLELEKLKVRAELKSADLEEDTGLIEIEAKLRAEKQSSTPAPAKGIVAILNTLPPWGRVAVLLALLGVVAASGMVGAMLSRLGWAPH